MRSRAVNFREHAALDALLAAAELGAGAPFLKGIKDIFICSRPVHGSDLKLLTRPFANRKHPWQPLWYRPETHLYRQPLH